MGATLLAAVALFAGTVYWCATKNPSAPAGAYVLANNNSAVNGDRLSEHRAKLAARTATRPPARTTPHDETWLADFPPERRAQADNDASVVAVTDAEFARLYPPNEQYVITRPDGIRESAAPDVVMADLEAADPIRVDSWDEGAFDYILLPYRDRTSGEIAAIVTLLMRGNTAVPTEFATYRPGSRLAGYPFLSEGAAALAAHTTSPAIERIFFPSPVSPKPMLFVYHFETAEGTVYVSQDGAVWPSLEAMLNPH